MRDIEKNIIYIIKLSHWRNEVRYFIFIATVSICNGQVCFQYYVRKKWVHQKRYILQFIINILGCIIETSRQTHHSFSFPNPDRLINTDKDGLKNSYHSQNIDLSESCRRCIRSLTTTCIHSPLNPVWGGAHTPTRQAIAKTFFPHLPVLKQQKEKSVCNLIPMSVLIIFHWFI